MATRPFAAVALLLVCSIGLPSCEGVDRQPIQQPTDGVWELQVERSWERAKSRSLSFELKDEDYVEVANGPRYSIVVSEGGSKVEIREVGAAVERPAMKGERSSSGETGVYWLQEGTFAGGQLVLSSHGEKHGAVLKIFGSGVPIVSSQLGTLSKKH